MEGSLSRNQPAGTKYGRNVGKRMNARNLPLRRASSQTTSCFQVLQYDSDVFKASQNNATQLAVSRPL